METRKKERTNKEKNCAFRRHIQKNTFRFDGQGARETKGEERKKEQRRKEEAGVGGHPALWRGREGYHTSRNNVWVIFGKAQRPPITPEEGTHKKGEVFVLNAARFTRKSKHSFMLLRYQRSPEMYFKPPQQVGAIFPNPPPRHAREYTLPQPSIGELPTFYRFHRPYTRTGTRIPIHLLSHTFRDLFF